MRAILSVAILALALPAAAQFDIGRMINKTIETSKKLQEANKEFSTADEIELGNGVTAGLLGAVKLHSDANLQRYVNRDRKSTRLNSSHSELSRMPSSA